MDDDSLKAQFAQYRKRFSRWGRKSANSAFISVFQWFNSREITVAASSLVRQRDYYRNDQIGASGMALATENFLRGNLLWERLKKHPAETLHEIDEFYRVSQMPDYLMHAADVCRYLAKKAPPEKAVTCHLTACYLCYRFLFERKRAADCNEQSATHDFQLSTIIQIYNETIAGVFRYLKEQKLLHKNGFTLHSLDGRKVVFEKSVWELSVPSDAIAELSLCSDFNVQGLWLINRHAGVGVPLVATVAARKISSALKTPGGLTLPVTMLMHIAEHEDGSLGFRALYQDTSQSETLTIAPERLMPGTWLLARDFTTPFACFLNSLEKRNLLAVMLNPVAQQRISGLYMVDTYDPAKIPVVCVHGLMSSPETWGQMINTLRNAPAIRKRYQFWFYSYSSGFPITYSAHQLRKALFAAQREFCTTPEATENFEKMVIIGHSMGGMVTRLLLQDDPYFLLTHLSGRSLAELQATLTPENMELLNTILVHDALPFVRRAIFLATPHRGAAMAKSLIAQLGVTLTKLPPELVRIARDVRKMYKLLFEEEIPGSDAQFFTGISNLDPRQSIVRALGDSPVKRSIIFHSVIGNQKAAETGGSDGVVPYESSHLEGAASEFMVQSSHNVQKCPAAIREVLRILLEHL